MLDRHPQAEQLEVAMRGLKCLLALPPEYASETQDRAEAPVVPGCGRRFHRFNCTGTLAMAGLCYPDSSEPVQRKKEWYRIYTVNISRGGLQILHHEQLYPGEVFKVGLLDGSQRLIRIAWCRRVNERCYQIGAAFFQEDDS